MDFIGSKVKLNDWLFSNIKAAVPPGHGVVFLDACSGSGAVSRYAAANGYHVVSNDIMAFPRAIANGSIGVSPEQKTTATKWIKHINSLGGTKGFFTNNYSKSAKRQYFTTKNAKLIDHTLSALGLVDDMKLRDYLTYCSLEAMSRVSNTAGTHGAFLKKIKDRATQKFTVREEETVNGTVEVYSKDILALLTDAAFRQQTRETILYIDPPYNQRQYGPNYHLYETFAKNDNPQVGGVTGLRKGWQNESGSEFCTKKNCLNFLCNVVDSTTAQYVFVSYSTDGLLTLDEIRAKYPDVKVYTMDQRRYKADCADNRVYNKSELKEYLLEIKK